jgi:hypothetical protein
MLVVNAILSMEMCTPFLPFEFYHLRVDLAIHWIHKMIDMVDHEVAIKIEILSLNPVESCMFLEK